MTSKKAKIIGKENNSTEFNLEFQSSETIFSNEDLLTQILLRVPAKSLIKFKCVSKIWQQVISDSRFVYEHYAINRHLISGIYFRTGTPARGLLKTLSLRGHVNPVSFPFLHEFKHYKTPRFEHSSNGLVLFSVRNEDYCVCNLTTQKYEILLHDPCIPRLISQALLAFDPTISPYFKVLLAKDNGSSPMSLSIYSSNTKSWKHVQINLKLYLFKMAYWDGFIHFMDGTITHTHFIFDENKLIATQMPIKPKLINTYEIRYFGECGGELILIQGRRRSLGFKILEMKRGTCFWNVKYRVNLKPVLHVEPIKDYYLLGIVKESHESDHKLVLATPSKLISYDLKKKTVDSLGAFTMGEYCTLKDYPRNSKSPFIENLLPVSFDTKM